MALMTNGHSEVTDGNGPTAPDSYESADPLDEGVAISHFGVTDGGGAPVPETTSHSYDNQDSGDSAGEIRTISHSGVTDGEESKAPEPTSHSYENPDFSTSTEPHGAIGHSGVTDGSEETLADENSLSNQGPDSELSSATQEPISHSAVTDELDQGQEYLPRRVRVRELVMNHRGYYTRSFTRGGLPSAVEYFSRSPGHEQELMDQVGPPGGRRGSPAERRCSATGNRGPVPGLRGFRPVRGRAVPGLRQTVRNPRRGDALHRLHGTPEKGE